MANLDSRIVIAGKTPNVDYKYGPYVGTPESVHNTLATYQYNVEGLTVGIKATDNSPVEEYWYVGGILLENLVPKQPEVPEQVQSDWTESDQTKPAFILHKPTISDGGQGSPQLPIAGNIKVTASAATSGQTTGVAVTAGQNGVVNVTFTLEKGEKGDTGETGPHGPQGVQGLSAFEVWKETTGRTTATEPEYIADLQTKVAKWIPVAYEATAASATIGDTVTFTTAPSNPIDGAIVLMPNAGSGATASMMFAVSSDGQTPATYTYTYIGDLNIDTTGLLGSGDVDGTRLVNPAHNALAKATDVMPIKQTLGDIIIEEVPATYTPISGSYVNGTNEQGVIITSNANCEYAIINVEGYKKVRFVGLIMSNSAGTTPFDRRPVGFAFGTLSDNTFTATKYLCFEKSTNSLNTVKEYIIDIPYGCTHFAATTKYYSSYNFYCYLQKGDDVKTTLHGIKKEYAVYGRKSGWGALSRTVIWGIDLIAGHSYKFYAKGVTITGNGADTFLIKKSDGSTTYKTLNSITSSNNETESIIRPSETLLNYSIYCSIVAGDIVIYGVEDITDESLLNNNNKIPQIDNRLTTLENTKKLINVARGYLTNDNNYGLNYTDSNAYHVVDYIPVNVGDKITWEYGDSGVLLLLTYNNNKEKVGAFNAYGAKPGTTAEQGYRNDITIPNGVAYIRLSWIKNNGRKDGNPLITNPLTINDVKYTIDEFTYKIDSNPDPNEPKKYGILGQIHADQINIARKEFSTTSGGATNRLLFAHVSDSHEGGTSSSKVLGYANQIVDNLYNAMFLLHTGDFVEDEFTGGYSKALTLLSSMSKPYFIALGNHDYYKSTTKSAVKSAFIDAMVSHNNTINNSSDSLSTTYYSKDFTTQKVKLISLDINDGWSDSVLASQDPNDLTFGNMSHEQIEWFIDELESAITNALHVVIAIHTIPVRIDPSKYIENFRDVPSLPADSLCGNLAFLTNIVDAFINGESYSVTYNNETYSGQFTSSGHFIAWIAGHSHFDDAGWLYNHPKQFAVRIMRPIATNIIDAKTYTGNGYAKTGTTFNLYAIDTDSQSKRFSCLRIGDNKTIFGTEKKGFSIVYY